MNPHSPLVPRTSEPSAILALILSWFGTITSIVTEARELISLLAAIGSVIATAYTIALTRRKLLSLKSQQSQSQAKPNPDHE